MNASIDNGESGPHFIGVGPEKTGTTWVHEQFARHPDLWLPPQKELSYFWQDIDHPGETALDRLTGRSWHHQRARHYAKSRLRQFVRHPHSVFADPARAKWDARYILRRHDDDWYRSCFDDGGGRLRAR